jgi:hypothetical protein
MFWKRKPVNTVISSKNGYLMINNPPPIPPKKEFESMLELLRDAEKYDNSGEAEVSLKQLETLREYIDKYCLSVPQKNK